MCVLSVDVCFEYTQMCMYLDVHVICRCSHCKVSSVMVAFQEATELLSSIGILCSLSFLEVYLL